MIKKIVIANVISFGLFTVIALAATPLLAKATMKSFSKFDDEN